MPRPRGIAIALGAAALCAPAAVAPASAGAAAFVPGELLVGFDPGVSSSEGAALARGEGARIAERLPGAPNVALVNLPPGLGPAAGARRFEARDGVRFAEPNYLYELAEEVDDPFFSSQWGLENVQQFGGSVLDADIDAEAAWGALPSIPAGSPDISVAVIDTGIDLQHPDLAPNLWSNPLEATGTTGVDDDGNGKIDDIWGWNFFGEDNDPTDPNSHGTHVSGIVGAVGDNGEGVSGVNWEVGLMPLRASSASGQLASADVVEAIGYAAEMGADVVNMSFVGTNPSDSQRLAIEAAPDVLFVAAAGNGGDDFFSDDNDLDDQYPCGYELPNVVCVASTTVADQLAGSSNFGNDSVDLGAPGAGIASTVPGDTDRALANGGFEGTLAGSWMTGGAPDTWGATDEFSFGGDMSLADSPGTGVDYADDTDSFARNVTPVDLAGFSGCRVHASVEHDLGAGDTFSVEGGTSEAGPWTELASFTGAGTAADQTFPVDPNLDPAFHGTSTFFLRFHLTSDDDTEAGDGVYVDNVSIDCDGAYAFKSGTSMATPHVAGAAALLLDAAPWYDVADLRGALLGNVDPLPALRCRTFTGGRLNLHSSIVGGPPPGGVAQDCPPPPPPEAVPEKPAFNLKLALKRCKQKLLKASKAGDAATVRRARKAHKACVRKAKKKARESA